MASARRAFAVAESEELYDAAMVNAASESSQINKFDVVFGESLDLEGSAAFTKQVLVYDFNDVEADDFRASNKANKLFEMTLDPLDKKKKLPEDGVA
ncbi:hypothetical protein PHYPSEUDO_002659 [Phytophthora pseudosyringae]|uniref:Uncharacterized protein n=1 Tax=Phytophthora pseudosyringae TaxID=221518 RepID=A0A8T1VVY1_9STRA|nr:hypothetical protein PHYPSEUDO_002659 [Phytophthora pseudosyringae]